jgi:hypothetical protein
MKPATLATLYRVAAAPLAMRRDGDALATSGAGREITKA